MAEKLESIARSLVLPAAVIGLLASPATAADLPLAVRAPVAPIWTWTGLYLGVDVGWGWGTDSTIEYFTGTNLSTGLSWDYKTKGALGGVFAGANYQIGSAVVGIEGDIEGTSIHGGFNDPALGGAGDTRVHWQGSVRGRLGIAADKVLVYGTGGLAYADISHTYKNLAAVTAETTDGVRLGWTAGAGVEMAVSSNLLLRAEYRYSDFGKYRYDSVVTFPGLTGEQQPTFNAVRAGAAYKF